MWFVRYLLLMIFRNTNIVKVYAKNYQIMTSGQVVTAEVSGDSGGGGVIGTRTLPAVFAPHSERADVELVQISCSAGTCRSSVRRNSFALFVTQVVGRGL